MVNNTSIRRAVRLALLMSAAPAAFYASSGVAQNAAAPAAAAPTAKLEEIVVTGTRIASPNLKSISPVSSISSAEIAESGKPRVEDILNSMPQVFAAQGANISNGSNGTATVNLRGLGVNRTVVLVNGRRLHTGSAGGGSAADINFVPAELIKRIDILTGGASATYGADAVGGVVNFIMDNDFQGLQLNYNYEYYDHNNSNPVAATVAARPNYGLPPKNVHTGFGRDLSFKLGMSLPDGKGNAVFYGTYRKADPILQASYDYSSCTLNSGDTFSCGGSTTTGQPFSNGRFRLKHLDGSNAGLNSTFLADGSLVTYPSTTAFANANAYNFGPLNFYQRPDERYTMGTFAHYDFNEHATAYTEIMYMNDSSTSQIAPSGAFSGGHPTNPGGALFVSCDNPGLSAQMVATWCRALGLAPTDNTLVFIGRRNVEGGGRQQTFNFGSYRIVAGARGDINDDWRYDASGMQGSVNFSSVYLNDFSWTKIQNSLLVHNVAGVPTCQAVIDGSDPACVPWNIFQVGAVTPLAAQYLAIPLLARGSTLQRVLDANVTGDLSRYVKLPSAPSGLSLNFGVDWTSQSSDFQPDEAFQKGLGAGQGAATLPIGGSVKAKEFYTEAGLPLIADRPGAQNLAINAGFRYSEYDLTQGGINGAKGSFNASTYKFGVEWSPINELRLRASYQQATRVPNVGELYAPVQVGLDGVTDPCSGPTPALSAAQCLNTGVTALQYGNVDNNPANQYNGRLGGNPNLQPEKAKTTSFGVAYQPAFAPGLRLQVDYFDIKVDNAVQNPGADFTLLLCGTTGNPAACARIHRDGTGSLLTNGGYVDDQTVNIGSLLTKGIDFDGSYSHTIGAAGKLGFSLVATHLNAYEVTPQAGVTYDCVGLYGPTCIASAPAGAPTPKDRFTLRTNWGTPWHGLDVTLGYRYISSVKVETLSSNYYLSQIGALIGIPATDASMASRGYLDLTSSISFAGKYKFRLGANNLLDKDPPIIGGNNCPAGPCNGNTYPQTYDATGRKVFASITATY